MARRGHARIHEAAARGFARSADLYERARPEYPPEAIAWLSERLALGPGRVLVDLAAGTGKLTRPLVATGARVIAVEPVEEMRARIGPGAEALDGTAEAIPVAAASADAVTVGQAFHWFDGPVALGEIHRVLRPRGTLAVVWNHRPLDDPVQAAVERIVAPHRRRTPAHTSAAWQEAFAATALFELLEERAFTHARPADADALADRVGSTSFIAALPDAERAVVLAEVRAIAAEGPVPLTYVCEVALWARRP